MDGEGVLEDPLLAKELFSLLTATSGEIVTCLYGTWSLVGCHAAMGGPTPVCVWTELISINREILSKRTWNWEGNVLGCQRNWKRVKIIKIHCSYS